MNRFVSLGCVCVCLRVYRCVPVDRPSNTGLEEDRKGEELEVFATIY